MQPDYLLHVALHAIVGVGSPVFFGFLVFTDHTASRWIRWVFVFLGIAGVPWGILGVLRLGFPGHFTRATRASFDHYETLLAGFALGLLASLLLSPEFWQKFGRPHHNRSNQSLEPTPDRPENSLQ